jgi:hypothetical protein
VQVQQQMVERFYQTIGLAWEKKAGAKKTSTNVLLHYAKQQMQGTRQAVYDLMAAVAGATNGWGIRVLFSNSDFVAYIFDRHTETEKLDKEWKFSVVAAAYACPLKVLLGPSMVDKLEMFLKDGPFYSETAAPTVALGLRL